MATQTQYPDVWIVVPAFNEAAVIGEVVHWLATSDEADVYKGKCIEGQEFCYQNNLLPGWTPKTPLTGPTLYPPE